MGFLPSHCKKSVELVEIMKNGDPSKRGTVVVLLQDMLEVVTDMMVNEIRELAELHQSSKDTGQQVFAGTEAKPAILFPPVVTAQWEEQIRRLYLLLTVKETAAEVPTNSEVHRRVSFFTNSLFMDMPRAPRVRKMLTFSVLTPYYGEETVYSKNDIEVENEDGVSIMYYLQKIFPEEWSNFLERLECKKDSDIWEKEENILQLRHWASLRGQTLCRTVRGMMYYRRAIKLQAFLDMASEKAIWESEALWRPSCNRYPEFDGQEIYRIKLPGPAKLGEGKPENKNHAIIFTRGEALQAIDMNQIKAAVSVLWNSHGLNWPYSFEQQRQKTGDLDMLDWLRAMFGFQRDNVRNQREHLILLLANSHIRLHPKPKPFNLAHFLKVSKRYSRGS
ncbi:hypothetical protein JHK84_037321 [Glycine max]|nr:hypothetical protein JHK84_037321 [Glycine max]